MRRCWRTALPGLILKRLVNRPVFFAYIMGSLCQFIGSS